MDFSETGVLADLISRRRGLIELLLVTLFAALGINLISSSIVNLLGLSDIASFSLGLLLCLGGIIYFVFRFLGGMSRYQNYSSLFVYDKDRNKIVTIPKYNFSIKLCNCIEAALVENADLRYVWDNNPLKDISLVVDDKNQIKQKAIQSKRVLKEAVEYVILLKLSEHLAAYFANDDMIEINELQRDDIADVILSNRFLDLFSRSIDERVAFAKAKEGGNILASLLDMPADSAHYVNFSLYLPKNGSIKRITKNILEINTRKFTILLNVKFDGRKSKLPFDFIKYYLGLIDESKVEIYAIDIIMKINFKFNVLLSLAGLRSRPET